MSVSQTETEVLVTARASPLRRMIGLATLAALGLFLIYAAFAQPTGGMLWKVVLVALGGAILWIAEKMRSATASGIELTATELRDMDGTTIARIDELQSVDRGVFAFKPSNGFLLRTSAGAGNAWRPGLWWRVGRRIGVGGMTPANQTKAMSEIIAQLVADRQT